MRHATTTKVKKTSSIRDRIKDFRRVKASDLLPDPHNWRTHPPAQRAALAGVLDEIGIADAVLARETADGLQLIDGHLRAELDPSVEWPVLVLDVTEAEAKKILATHDPLTAMAEPDESLLADLLAEIETESDALQKMLDDLPAAAVEIEIVEDEVPEPPAEPVTRTGDLIKLGRHSLLCGDATNADDVARLMDGAEIGAVVTDPPYGINAPQMTLGTGKKTFIREDWDSRRLDVTRLLSIAPVSIIWGGNYFADSLPTSNDWLCWHKKNDGLSFSEFELAWTNIGRNARHLSHHWSGENKLHPTMKPVSVMSWCVGFTSGKILDLFLGSGTTLIAAEQLDRTCYGMEISPAYCDVVVERWEKLTGEKAKRPKRKKMRAANV
jgi:hypothetical protein